MRNWIHGTDSDSEEDESVLITALDNAMRCRSLLVKDTVLTPRQSALLHQGLELNKEFDVGDYFGRPTELDLDPTGDTPGCYDRQERALKDKADLTTYIRHMVYDKNGDIYSLSITYILDGKMWSRNYNSKGIRQFSFENFDTLV